MPSFQLLDPALQRGKPAIAIGDLPAMPDGGRRGQYRDDHCAQHEREYQHQRERAFEAPGNKRHRDRRGILQGEGRGKQGNSYGQNGAYRHFPPPVAAAGNLRNARCGRMPHGLAGPVK